MNKIIFILFISLFTSMSVKGQDELTAENRAILTQLYQKLEQTKGSYLVSFEKNRDHAILLFKHKDIYMVNINRYTYKSPNLNSEEFKKTANKLGADDIYYDSVNPETNTVVEKIHSYKFEIPAQEMHRLDSIIIVLLSNPKEKTQDTLTYEFTGA